MSASLQKEAVELAWRHWTALGVAGVAPLPEVAVDLEALIAFTPFIAAQEPRLERECVDWCTRIGPDTVSISRLRQVARLMPARFESAAHDLPGLAIAASSSPRSDAGLSNKSRPPRLAHPSLIQLRSRRIFGLGARADILVALAMRGRGAEPVRISAMVSAGYTKRAVAMVIEDLTAAGLLEKLSSHGAAGYKLSRPAPLRALLGPWPKKVPRWPERLALVATVLEVWRQHGARAPSTHAIELAKALDRLRPMAAAIEQSPPLNGRPPVILANVDRWARGLLDPTRSGSSNGASVSNPRSRPRGVRR